MPISFGNIVDAIIQLCKDCKYYDDNSDIQLICNHNINDVTDVLVHDNKVSCSEFIALKSEDKSFYFADLED